MKTLLATFLLISTICFGQYEDEDDTLEFYTEYMLIDYSARTFLDFTPTEENIDWDRYTKIIYNPIVNYDVLDSIMKWRESKGATPILIDWDDVDKKMKDEMYFEAMDISKMEADKVTMGRYEDSHPDCDCSTSIVTNILDDSLIFVNGKKETLFKSYLLDEKIKRIEVYYYQVTRIDNPNKEESHLIVRIKRKFSLFTNVYRIF
jgi:hypothetical protein